jgi:hypothetical protein
MPARHALFTLNIATLVLFVSALGGAQNSQATTPQIADNPSSGNSSQWSGMYTFLKEGEFVQLTVEDQGQVTGLISRYGDSENDSENDKGAFLDQFFKKAKLAGNKLDFTTEEAHGLWFDFKGTVERGAGKNPGDEAYYVLKGTLTENSTDANKKVITHSRDVVLKMFPQEAASPPSPTN